MGTRVEEKAAKPVEVRTRQGNRYLEGPSKVCQAEKTNSITQFVGNCPSRYVQGGRSRRAGTRIDATGAWMIAVHDNTTVPCSILVKSRAFDRPKVLGRGGLPSGRMSAGVKHGTSLRHSARNSKGMDARCLSQAAFVYIEHRRTISSGFTRQFTTGVEVTPDRGSCVGCFRPTSGHLGHLTCSRGRKIE